MRLVLLLLLSLSACGISHDRYLHLRQIEDCRIFGPECIGDYETVEECLGDFGKIGEADDASLYVPKDAYSCIMELRQLCPVRAVDFVVPPVCDEVYDGQDE